MSALVRYVLLFFHTVSPISNHAYYEKPEITEARYESIAETISTVAVESPVFSDDDSGVKTALLLGSIATYESSLRDDIDTCKKSGDTGQAWSLFQIHGKKEVLCASREDAARSAREIIRASFKACKSLPVMDRLSLYTDGSCHEDWKRSRSRMFRATSFQKSHPFVPDVLETAP